MSSEVKRYGGSFVIEANSDIESTMTRLAFATSGIGLGIFHRQFTGPWIAERAARRFAAEGDDAVGAWQPLMESTNAIRETLGYDPAHPINKRTGDLEDLIVNKPYDLMIGPEMATMTAPGKGYSGELREKLSTAQIGKADPRTPARPVIGLSVTDLMAVEGALLLYIEGVVR